MHTCKTCGSCMNLDRNLAYLTDPPQYKCKESGRLHFQFDVCDLSADANIANIESIIEALKRCTREIQQPCKDCPYYSGNSQCIADLMRDALKWLEVTEKIEGSMICQE